MSHWIVFVNLIDANQVDLYFINLKTRVLHSIVLIDCNRSSCIGEYCEERKSIFKDNNRDVNGESAYKDCD